MNNRESLKQTSDMINRRIILLAAAVLAALTFPSAAQTLRGDFNMDGKVDVSDVTTAISCLLNGTSGAVGPEGRDTVMVGGEPLVMVRVKAGTYTRRPGVVKTVSSDFWLGQLEVSMELWKTVMGAYPQSSPGLDTDQPAYPLSVEMTLAFIDSLNRMTGLAFRLPTPDEWEFAAYGGVFTHGYTYAGSENIDEIAWYRGNMTEMEGYDEMMGYNSKVIVRRGTKKPNELGLYDMCGGVVELCATEFGGEPRYEYRGGYFRSLAEHCDPYVYQHWVYITQVTDGCGLRLALSAAE